MPQKPNTVYITLGEVSNSCFVAMPYDLLFKEEYKLVIRPAIEAADLECVRADETFTSKPIIQDIWDQIRSARLVVAELTSANPNVLYEVGLAHALGKPIIFVTRDQDVPFDLRALRHIFYDTGSPVWGATLKESLTNALGELLGEDQHFKLFKDIEVHVTPPPLPTEGSLKEKRPEKIPALGGNWQGTWSSVKARRRHDASLYIPSDHGSSFDAMMTVTYTRGQEDTVIQEVLAGGVEKNKVTLDGKAYTYVKPGRSVRYSLDSFALMYKEEADELVGTLKVPSGETSITFRRVSRS